MPGKRLTEIRHYVYHLFIIYLGKIPIKLAYCKEMFFTEDIPYLIDEFAQFGQGRGSDDRGGDDYALDMQVPQETDGCHHCLSGGNTVINNNSCCMFQIRIVGTFSVLFQLVFLFGPWLFQLPSVNKQGKHLIWKPGFGLHLFSPSGP